MYIKYLSPHSDLVSTPAAWLNPGLPMQLDATSHYFVFFLGGYAIRKRNMFRFTEKLKCPSLWIILLCIVYLLMKMIVMILRNKYSPDSNLITLGNDTLGSFVVFLIISIAKFICGFCGVAVLYLLVTRYIVNKVVLTPWLIKLSTYCYGVYIYHQFILLVIYYQLPVADYVHSMLVPWAATVFTILISLMFTKLTLQTRLGRYLIG